MPKISNKGISMPSSPIRKLQPFAVEALKKGKKIYHLNIGQPDIKTPKAALDAVKNSPIDVLAYSPSQGYNSYLSKLTSYYKKNNINSSIIISNSNVVDIRPNTKSKIRR